MVLKSESSFEQNKGALDELKNSILSSSQNLG